MNFPSPLNLKVHLLKMVRRLIILLCVPLALNLLVGTPVGTYRCEGETEEAPETPGEEVCSLGTVAKSERTSRKLRHTLQAHFHAQSCANHRCPASTSAGQRILAKDGHRLPNGLRAPLVT